MKEDCQMDTQARDQREEGTGKPGAAATNLGLRWTAINLNRSLRVLACLESHDVATARELLELYVNDSVLALAHAEKSGRLSEAESRALASGVEYRLANPRCEREDAVCHASQLHAAAARVADEATAQPRRSSMTEWISDGAKRLFAWPASTLPNES